MRDPIEQIIQVHPEFEQMQARFEVELGEVRQELQKMERDRDEWQEKAEGADYVVYEERKFLEDLKTIYNRETKMDERRELTLTEFEEALRERREPRWNSEYGVLDEVLHFLEHIKAERVEVKWRETERIVKVEVPVLPSSLTINDRKYNEQS